MNSEQELLERCIIKLVLCIVEQVNWDDERECFRDVSKECSHFYSIRKRYILEVEPGEEQVWRTTRLR